MWRWVLVLVLLQFGAFGQEFGEDDYSMLFNHPRLARRDSYLKGRAEKLGFESSSYMEQLEKGHRHSKKKYFEMERRRRDGTTDPQLPGDLATPFSLETLNGTFTYDPSVPRSYNSLIFHAYESRSGFMDAMWTHDQYLDDLFLNTPETAQFVFMSYSVDAREQVILMRSRLIHRMDALGFSSEELQGWLSRFNFVTQPIDRIQNWVKNLLTTWESGLDLVEVFDATPNISEAALFKRLDARWPWLPSADVVQGFLEVGLFGDGCSTDGFGNRTFSKKVALVTSKGCSYAEKIFNAQSLGASAVIVQTEIDEFLIDMNCEGLSCGYPVFTPATQMTYLDGEYIRKRVEGNENVTVQFQTIPTSLFHFAIDGQNTVQETGYLMYPSWLFLAWEAQWFDFQTSLVETVASTDPAMDLLIYDHDISTCGNPYCGIYNQTVTIPFYDQIQNYGEAYLDFEMDCNGDFDTSCPPWDRTVSLTVCCDLDSPLCGEELGRWINPFGRQMGRWLTDVSPLTPLLTSPTCNFSTSWETYGNIENWVLTLHLRLGSPVPPNTPVPFEIMPLFQGGTFNQEYNEKYQPLLFSVPQQTVKAELVSVITGHGSDNHNCAEFCVTSHHFLFNNVSYDNITFTNAGTQMGCAMTVPQGVFPNEYGTWLYGRDGWCDGQEVAPWVVDVTSQIFLRGPQNTVTYFGYYHDHDPNPTNNNAYIIMHSFLVFFRESS